MRLDFEVHQDQTFTLTKIIFWRKLCKWTSKCKWGAHEKMKKIVFWHEMAFSLVDLDKNYLLQQKVQVTSKCFACDVIKLLTSWILSHLHDNCLTIHVAPQIARVHVGVLREPPICEGYMKNARGI